MLLDLPVSLQQKITTLLLSENMPYVPWSKHGWPSPKDCLQLCGVVGDDIRLHHSPAQRQGPLPVARRGTGADGRVAQHHVGLNAGGDGDREQS